jgi:sucrose phosphorylase
MTQESRIADHLTFLYGAERAPALLERLRAILTQFRQRNPQLPAARESLAPQTLTEVLEKYARGVITGVHVLPFFPYSSDDGFSVIDYTAVNPDFGTWADVERLGRNFRLMFDAVINHISAHSGWFQEFLKGNPGFADYFIVVEEGTDLSQVVRPRALPLLTSVQTAHGERLVWTTFSADQIDLNYANPDVLLEIIEILLLYVEKGAEIIRLDAIAYLWKKIGTPCIHLEETHRVVKLFRTVFDAVAPHVMLITETNVPHEENISYFGDGTDEAQMVYQFPLAPLVLNAFHSGSARHLSGWAATLETPSDTTTFFNFLASHDGVGVTPALGILSGKEIQELVEKTKAHGGYASCRANPDGTQSVYELNISYFDALSDPRAAEPLDLQARRFLASQAIMLALVGVPGIYIHSLFGSRSYHAGVEQTGHYRSINREKFRRSDLERELANPASLRNRIFYSYLHLIRTRTAHRAFHPNAPQQVLSVHPALFVLLRPAPDRSTSLLCIHNVSNAEQPFQVDLDSLLFPRSGRVRDLITRATFPVDASGNLTLDLAPYQVLWLTGCVG